MNRNELVKSLTQRDHNYPTIYDLSRALDATGCKRTANLVTINGARTFCIDYVVDNLTLRFVDSTVRALFMKKISTGLNDEISLSIHNCLATNIMNMTKNDYAAALVDGKEIGIADALDHLRDDTFNQLVRIIINGRSQVTQRTHVNAGQYSFTVPTALIPCALPEVTLKNVDRNISRVNVRMIRKAILGKIWGVQFSAEMVAQVIVAMRELKITGW